MAASGRSSGPRATVYNRRSRTYSRLCEFIGSLPMRLKSFLVGAGLLLLPAIALGQAPVPLGRTAVVDRPIAAGETYDASLALREGESADIVVLQQGIDLV